MSDPPFTVRRDAYGHATAIDHHGHAVLILVGGATRNEEKVGDVVATLNRAMAPGHTDLMISPEVFDAALEHQSPCAADRFHWELDQQMPPQWGRYAADDMYQGRPPELQFRWRCKETGAVEWRAILVES